MFHVKHFGKVQPAGNKPGLWVCADWQCIAPVLLLGSGYA